MAVSVFVCQPRPVAGFRGTVRYASVNAHKNKVSTHLPCARALVQSVMLPHTCRSVCYAQLNLFCHDFVDEMKYV